MLGPSRALGWAFLVFTVVSLADGQSDILYSYDEIDAYLRSSVSRDGSDVVLRLAPTRAYTFTAPLTAAGLSSFVLEASVPDNNNDLPVIICGDGVSSAFDLNATVVRIANVHIRNCSGTAVILRSPANIPSFPVDWSFQNVSFSGNLAMAQTVAQPAQGFPFIASALLVPELCGALKLSGCSFERNNGVGTAVASPPLAVSCRPGAVNCNVSISNSTFVNNSGRLVSGALLQVLGGGSALLSITESSFGDNFAAYIPTMRLYGTRNPFPPAALLVHANSIDPAVVQVTVHDAVFQNNKGSHGLAIIGEVPPANDDCPLELNLSASNISLTGHSSGPAALLAYGVRTVNISDIFVGHNLVPPFNISNFVNWMGGGAAACIGVYGVQGTVALYNATFINNSVFDSGALCVTTVLRLALSNVTSRGRFEARDLRLVGTRSTMLGQAGQVCAIADVSIVGGKVYNNSGGGGLLIESSRNVELRGIGFHDNVRGKMTDKVGTPMPASEDGGALWLNLVEKARLADCSFGRNGAARDGGAAAFVLIGSMRLSNVTAMNNTVVEGSGGAFAFKNASEIIINDTVVSGNMASGGGGGAAAFIDSVNMKLNRVVFDSNIALGTGGALYIYNSPNGKSIFTSCNFTRNAALGAFNSSYMGPGGGGAVYAQGVQANMEFSYLTVKDNKAPRAAGGAFNLQSAAPFKIFGSVISGNEAGLHGGAMYLKMGTEGSSQVISCTVNNNKAGVVAATSIGGGSYSSSSSYSDGLAVGASGGSSDRGAGMGGAVYLEITKLVIKCSQLLGNVASLSGGAVAAQVQSQLEIMGDEDVARSCPMLLQLPGVPRASRRSASVAVLTSTSVAPSQPSSSSSMTQSSMSVEHVDAPYATLLVGNSAITGGAVFVQDSVLRLQDVTVFKTLGSPGVLFANNSAAAGGAISIYAGREAVVIADFVNNTAEASAAAVATVAAALGGDATALLPPDNAGAGGAIAVRGSKTTALTVLNSAFIHNTAVYGGAVHLATSESCTLAEGCYLATLAGCVLVNNTAIGGAGGGVFWEHLGLLSVSCPSRKRKYDSSSQPQQPTEPPLPPTEPTLPPPAPPPPPIMASYHRAPPMIIASSDLLPCDTWADNAAIDGAYGNEMASTGFTLNSDPHYVDFYTSSSPIAVRLSVYDYYGQLCTGGNSSVVIRAVSKQVFGQTYMAISRGTAAFTDLKLRAQSGWHDIDFTASTEYRDLLGVGITVYVRPCVIGEYLSPTMDQCLGCSPSYYNFNHTANQCQLCDAHALCADPDSRGMIIPKEGYWQSNFFSEQVLSCPNPNACSYLNRTANLSYIQLQVINISTAIQASLVQFPNMSRGSSSNGPSAGGGGDASSRRLQVQHRLRQLRQLLERRYAESIHSNIKHGQAARHVAEPKPGSKVGSSKDTELLRRLRTLLASAEAPPPSPLGDNSEDGDNPYGAWYDDDTYVLLMKAVGPLLANYSAAQCAKGYMGVLCGSCAPGYGSTAPAQCRQCPNRVVNNTYYAMAVLLTGVILTWTIRSLLTQSLFAAHQARRERKLEVMSEMRLMGRPIINPSLIAVLDEDEMPDPRAAQPIYGPLLPPYLEGLVALRQSYQLQQQDMGCSSPVEQGQQQQQQRGTGGISASYRSPSNSQQSVMMMTNVSSYFNPRGSSPTAPPPPPPPPPRTRGWTPRRLMGSVVPTMQISQTSGDEGGCRGVYGVLEGSSAAASTYTGIVHSVASSPFTMRPGPAAAVLDHDGCSCSGNVVNYGIATPVPAAAAAAAILPTAGADVGQCESVVATLALPQLTALDTEVHPVKKAPGPWNGERDSETDLKPSDGETAHDNDIVLCPWLDSTFGESSHEQAHVISQSGLPPHRICKEHMSHYDAPAAAAATPEARAATAAVVATGVVPIPIRRSYRPQLMSPLAASSSVCEVPSSAMCYRAGRHSATAQPEMRPNSMMLSGMEFDTRSLVAPRTASATTAVLGRPWLAGPSLNGDFPRRQRSISGNPRTSPRIASVTGSSTAFMAEVRRRQFKAEAAGLGRMGSRSLLGSISRLGRSAEDGGGISGNTATAAAAGEIEPLPTNSGSTSRSLLSLGGVLRRRLASPTGLGMITGGNVSRAASLETSRLAVAVRAAASGYGSGGMHGGGGGGVSTSSIWPGGGGGQYDEYGGEDSGPYDEVLGTPVVWSSAAASPLRAASAAIGSPPAVSGGEGGEGVVNTFRRDNATDANPLQDAATIKIFISYVQILALVKAVPIPNPPKSVLNYLRFYDQITAIPGSLVSLDCSLPDNLTISKAMQRTILAALAPLYVSVAVAVVWLGIMLVSYHSSFRSSAKGPPNIFFFARSYMPPRLVMSFATVMFYFYPNTVRSLLSIFSCVSVDSSSTDNNLAMAAGLHPGKYWTLDYSDECYKDRHLALALGLGMSGLLIMGVGWPVGVALWLYRKGREQALDFSDFSMVVYASYREMYQLRYLFWESIIMLRQMLVAVVVVMLAQRGVALQMLVVIAVVALAFAAQLIVKPFRTTTMNLLEEVTLVVIIITLYLNLYLLSPGVPVTGRTILAVCIIGINAFMLAVFVYFITRTSWEKQLDHMGLDRSRVYEMDPQEIRASLRRRYGRRTAALLTRVVTSARTIQTAKASLYYTGSLVGRTVVSSFKRSEAGISDTAGASGDPVKATGKSDIFDTETNGVNDGNDVNGAKHESGGDTFDGGTGGDGKDADLKGIRSSASLGEKKTGGVGSTGESGGGGSGGDMEDERKGGDRSRSGRASEVTVAHGHRMEEKTAGSVPALASGTDEVLGTEWSMAVSPDVAGGGIAGGRYGRSELTGASRTGEVAMQLEGDDE